MPSLWTIRRTASYVEDCARLDSTCARVDSVISGYLQFESGIALGKKGDALT